MQKITAVEGVPVVGRRYLVPTVEYPYLSPEPSWWPLFFPFHNDQEFFAFPHEHYHVDVRFLGVRKLRQMAGRPIYWNGESDWPAAWRTAQRSPLGARRASAYEAGVTEWMAAKGLKTNAAGMIEPPPIVWRPLALKSAEPPPYQFHDAKQIKAMADHYGGHQCAKARTGWVCPHRDIPLGQFAPVDGIITCPLHGLRVVAATGKVLNAAGLPCAPTPPAPKVVTHEPEQFGLTL